MNPKVDWYFNKIRKWQQELQQLRTIILDCQLTEELKWGVPCYTYEKSNIVLIHVFKDYCAVLFIKGALLTDTHGILTQQTENTQATRQIRFTSIEEIVDRKTILHEYIYEAVELEEAGSTVAFKPTSAFSFPEEFQRKIDGNEALKIAFDALTPGRQRGYLLHFSSPKQAKTRESRIEKCIQPILDGKGLNEQ